jgi:hypothetical protein
LSLEYNYRIEVKGYTALQARFGNRLRLSPPEVRSESRLSARLLESWRTRP